MKNPIPFVLSLSKDVIRQLPRLRVVTSAARAVQADVYPHHVVHGIGKGWTDPAHGEYIMKSVPVYAAVMARANAMTRVPWQAHLMNNDGALKELPVNHQANVILSNPNPWFSGAALRRLTEMFLCLYGQAFWSIERSEDGTRDELWPLRPDRMDILAGDGRSGPYIRGYRYRGLTGEVFYLPEEIEWFRFDNPLQDRTGLSPMAPLRLSADMGLAALQYNRETFRNQAIPDFLIMSEESMTDQEVEAFYRRWEERFQGPNKANRPAIASQIKDIKTMAFSNRELEFLETLRWTVKDASRVLAVPETMLSELQYATLSNMVHLEGQFWRATMMPQTTMMSEQMTATLMPKLGFPGVVVVYNFITIDVLHEGRDQRVKRETEFMDRGALTINEVRRGYDLEDVSWGDEPHFKEAPPERKGDRPRDLDEALNTPPAEYPPLVTVGFNGHRE